MRFSALDVPGPVLVEIEPLGDERGLFARSFCGREFAAAGLPTLFPQWNISVNRCRGTVRGMHFQAHRMRTRNSSVVPMARSTTSSSICAPLQRRLDSQQRSRSAGKTVLRCSCRPASPMAFRRWRTIPRSSTPCLPNTYRTLRAAYAGPILPFR